MNWMLMPRVSLQVKAKILNHSCEAATPLNLDSSKGVPSPLFWAERKTPAFWTQLMKDIGVGAVFDLTPGTGPLARVCLDAGILYSATPINHVHGQWLDTLLDQHALESARTLGSAIYLEELALQIAEHFGDIVDFLNRQEFVPGDEQSEDYMED